MSGGKFPQVSECVVASTTTDNSTHVINLYNGASCCVFKTSACCGRNGFTCVGKDYIITSQSQKALLHSYQWGKEQVLHRSIPPEKVNCIASTADGSYVFAGGDSGNLYVWETAGGRLVRAIRAHFRAVTAIAVSDDMMHFVTGGDDAIVHVWSLTDVLDFSMQSPSAVCTWSDHTLPVTQIHCGMGGLDSYVFTSSQDCSVKIYDLGSRKLLVTVTFPCAINCVTSDAVDSNLFAGAVDANIYQIELKSGSQHSLAEAPKDKKYVGHKKQVNSVRTSASGVHLVSGSEDGTIRLWDVLSRQTLREFDLQQGPINHLAVVVERPEMHHQPIPATQLAPLSVLHKFACEQLPQEWLMRLTPQTTQRRTQTNLWQWCVDEFASSQVHIAWHCCAVCFHLTHV
eukprot:c6100_g1_i1.p1 GENE.c6100_g1_i1~~c6100_g1_i1.p1  ORF type:complete len:409 (+),score=81.32 c6100_g1_i1:30-1229(+)